ncbi:cysteine hydrolase family protein [Neisseria sp. Ec49-e6-T10]|uniref:cysteine hydrolase family protein n=1 Tax=Neisseria sp. Ec49-e6-T10 TaxID=3140744 RepID=UPI003EB92015
MQEKKRALVIIDVQNDYFPEGKFPLWQAEEALGHIEQAIEKAQTLNIPILLVQHIVEEDIPNMFFIKETHGVQIHPRLLTAVSNAPIITKHFTDSFFETQLDATLQKLGIEELLICGMMTQNCVVFTALSKDAAKYEVSVLSDCCAAVSQMVQQLTLGGLSLHFRVDTSDNILI